MSEVEHIQEEETRLDKVKEVIKNNWKPFTVGVVLTTVTFVVTRQISPRFFNGIIVRKLVVKDSVFLIQTYNRHQGPPSWMVRCGDELWRSQAAAAKSAGVSQSTMSRHLRGCRPHIKGRYYERVAIEVPRFS